MTAVKIACLEELRQLAARGQRVRRAQLQAHAAHLARARPRQPRHRRPGRRPRRAQQPRLRLRAPERFVRRNRHQVRRGRGGAVDLHDGLRSHSGLGKKICAVFFACNFFMYSISGIQTCFHAI